MDFSEARAWPTDSESDYEREYKDELPLRSTYFTQQHFADSGTSEVVIRQASNIPNQFIESETAFTNGDCFRFRSPSPSTIYSDAAIALTWTGITATPVQHTYSSYAPFYSRKLVNSRQLLRGVNGYAKAGRVLAVLGASGSGKSTLLDSLTFRSAGNLSVQGNIMANGEPVDNSITSLMAYVQQDEFFITTLTVREHLQFQAALRMNSEYHFQSKLEKVESLLQEIDLIDCADTLIGQPHCNGITLSERKKLAIASELLTNQPVIFYDEPTHGLDANAAMDIIQTLKGFANIGHTVVCTFRKASSQLYGLFDNIMLLAEGRCVYLGSPNQAIHFFSTMGHTCPAYHCPSDYFLHILATLPDTVRCEDSIEQLSKSFDNSSFGSKAYHAQQDETFKARVRRSSSVKDRVKKIKYYNTDWCTQFANLLWRNFMAMKRSVFLFHMHFLHLVVLSVFLGIAYFNITEREDTVQSTVGLLFIFIIILSTDTFWMSLKVTREELPLVVYENKIGLYRFDSYLIARYMAQLPSSILYPIISSTIVYWMTGLNPGWRNYFVFVGIIILVTNAGASWGLFLSVLTSSQTVIIIISIIFILPVLTMGGYFINIASSPLYLEWLEYFSWYRYAFEALSMNQWKDIDAKGCNHSIRIQCVESGEHVLKQFNINQDNLAFDFVALVGLCIGFQVLSLVVLLLKRYDKYSVS